MKNIQFLYKWSRLIHRFFVFFMMLFGLAMATTGMSMKYPQTFSLIDPATALFVHSTSSIFFLPIMGVMMVTGLYMFIHPYLIKFTLRRPVSPDTETSNQSQTTS